MPTCSNCGSEVPGTSTLCGSCGLPVDDISDSPALISLSSENTLSMPFPDLDNSEAEAEPQPKKDEFEQTLEVLADTEENALNTTDSNAIPLPEPIAAAAA